MTKGEILLIDVDDTLTLDTSWNPEECLAAQPRLDLIEKYNKLYMFNFMIIYTARRDELLPATLEWLRRNNIRWHAFSNLKSPGDKYLDDKAVHRDNIDALLEAE